MRAVVYKAPHQVAVEEVEDPRIQEPTDVIVKLTSTAICGSDLHMYEGRTAVQPGTVFGHELMGMVHEAGPAVVSIKIGDRVVLPFNISCGFCFNCARGFTNACLTTNPEQPGGAYGYVGMGPHRGGQADYVRVPYGDFNCLKVPGKPGDELEDDFVMLADIFPTGYHGTELAGVQPGSSVAVFGAGPVGLMAAYSAMLRGAATVYVVDKSAARLAKAKQIGAIPVDFTRGDAVEQIMQLRRDDPGIQGAMRPGEEKMAGVLCGIDAVGYEAWDESDPSHQKPTQVLEDLVRVVNPTGRVGIVGVYAAKDPGGVDPHARQGELELPWAKFFEKGIQVGVGQTPVKKYNLLLRDLIIAGRAKPSFIVSHRLPLTAAPDAYAQFDKRDEFTKIILKPAAA